MPYIKGEHRNFIDDDITDLLESIKSIPDFEKNKAGILNYVVTMLAIDLIGDPKYAKINEIVGALECCKLELYRRMASPYEDKKVLENGDVYFD